jgi:hypothetical protein
MLKIYSTSTPKSKSNLDQEASLEMPILSLTAFCRRNSFEHSLVKELGYDGYERLRRGFDRAFGGQEKVPTFSLVIDAGCGTGLVGEQVSSILFLRQPYVYLF